jgi:hypothetical protein
MVSALLLLLAVFIVCVMAQTGVPLESKVLIAEHSRILRHLQIRN